MGIPINQISAGSGLKIGGDIYIVNDCQHVKPGKGGAFVRARLKNMRTGQVMEKTLRSSDKFDEVFLEERKIQYSYNSGDSYHFLDQKTYEDMVLSRNDLGDEAIGLLKDNLEMTAVCHNHQVLKVILPTFVTFEIIATEPGFKGDSTRAGTKPATIETGTTIQVPLFVNKGDRVKVDTRTSQYVERVQK